MRFPKIIFFTVDLLPGSQTDFASLSLNEACNLWRNFTKINVAVACEYKFA